MFSIGQSIDGIATLVMAALGFVALIVLIIFLRAANLARESVVEDEGPDGPIA